MMQDATFSHPFTYWVGMDTDPRTTPEALAEFNRFYSTTHVGEVIAAHPGFVSATRYELLDQDPRSGAHVGPRWLAVYEMRDEAALQQYLKDNERPWLHRKKYSPWPPARKRAKTTWRMLWRKILDTGPSEQPPESMYVVGLNIPDDTDERGVAEFNQFYDATHVPEVMSYGGYARATRHEMVRAFAPPAPAAPRFCAIYDADAAATEEREARRKARPQLTDGPPTWQRRELVWHLVYTRIPPAD